MQVELLHIDKLKPNARNARTHPATQIRKLARAIQSFGFNVPVLIDDESMILAGHARVEAARLAGLDTIPTVRLSHLSSEHARTFAIADNKIATLAGWDFELLADEFEALLEMEVDLDLTGFDIGEVDAIMDQSRPDPVDDLPGMTTATPVVSRPGDVWRLGSHLLICAEPTEATLTNFLGEERATMALLDPPRSMLGASEGTDQLRALLTALKPHMREGAIAFLRTDRQHLIDASCAAEVAELKVLQEVVRTWRNALGNELYPRQHEAVLVLKNGNARQINNTRHHPRTDVWKYKEPSNFGGRSDRGSHPGRLPVALIADCIRDVTRPRDLVLDPYAGTGSTILAAELTKRRVRAIEPRPNDVDVAILRWQQQTEAKARLAQTGETFDDTRSRREEGAKDG